MSIEAIVGKRLTPAERASVSSSLANFDTISTQLAQARALLTNIRGASKNLTADLPQGFEAAVNAALAALPAAVE